MGFLDLIQTCRAQAELETLDEDDELDASWKFGPSDDGSFDRRECASFDSTESGVTAVSAGG